VGEYEDWDVVPCNLINTNILEALSTLKMEAVGSSETLVPIYQSIWCHIPEDSDFQLEFNS
jgi:hypothetical protein